MADRCDHCGVRMDGLEVHLDSCPTMNVEIRKESGKLKEQVEEWKAIARNLLELICLGESECLDEGHQKIWAKLRA